MGGVRGFFGAVEVEAEEVEVEVEVEEGVAVDADVAFASLPAAAFAASSVPRDDVEFVDDREAPMLRREKNELARRASSIRAAAIRNEKSVRPLFTFFFFLWRLLQIRAS